MTVEQTFDAFYPRPSVTGGPPYNVCVARNAAPWAYCGAYDNQTLVAKKGAVIGVEVQAAATVLERAGWDYGTDYQFLCLATVTDVVADLVSSDPLCMLGLMGLDVTDQYLQMGIQFPPVPTFYSGLAVVAYGAAFTGGGMWFFVKPFTWEVWVTWAVIVVVMMFVFYLAEISIPDEKGNLYQNGAMGMFDCFYESFFKTVNKKGPKVSEEISYPSKTIVLFSSFFFLVFWNLYTAQLAGLRSAQFIQSDVTGLQSLQGNSKYYVITPSTVHETVTSPPISINAQSVDWTADNVSVYYLELMNGAGKLKPASTQRFQPIIDAGVVSTRVPDALIVDYGQAALYQAQYCQLYIQGKSFHSSANSMAFPADASPEGVLAFGTLLALYQKETGELDDIEGKIKLALSRDVFSDQINIPYCKSKKFNKAKGSDPVPVTFEQITGLLVIVGIGSGIGLIWAALCIRRNRTWHEAHFKTVVSELRKNK